MTWRSGEAGLTISGGRSSVQPTVVSAVAGLPEIQQVKSFPSHKIVGGFGLAVVILIVIGALLLQSIRDQAATARWVNQTREVLEQTQYLLFRLSDSENGRRGFVMTGSERYLAHYRAGVARVEENFTQLRRMTADNPRQQQACDFLTPLIQKRLGILAESIDWQIKNGADSGAQLDFMERGQAVMEEIRQRVAKMDSEERKLLETGEAAARAHARRTIQFAVGGSLAGLGLMAWACALTVKENTRRRRAEEALRKGNEELEVRVTERTAELATAFDALRESEERVRRILDTALDAVITIDEAGKVTSWNPEAERVFGWTRQEIVGQRLSDTIIPLRYRDAHQRGLETFLATGKGPVLNTRIEITALHRDGGEFPVELSITPVRSEHHFVFSAFIRDITDRKHSEEEIRKLNASLEQRVLERTTQLEAVNKELEAFSYSVSHDLRAPLRHVDGFVDMLLQDSSSTLSDSGRRYLGVISESAKHMGTLIDDLLVFSRMGRAEIHRTRVDMNRLVTEVLREMAGDIQGRNIEWRIDPLPEVWVDRTLLKQVWVNLLANAAKYTRRRERGEIKIRCGTNGRDELEFSVQDNGAGFDMQYAGKLFGVFQRLHQAEEFEGTGIGLANVQRIITRHGGRTWAEGKVDEGATFYFTLPNIPKE